MPLNQSQAQVVDPVLTTGARGYSHAENVSQLLFPTAVVDTVTGKRIEFGKESFQKLNTRRAPGASTKQVQFGYQGAPYALNQHRLEAKIPKEIRSAAAVPGVNLLRLGVRSVQDMQSLEKEAEAAELALDANQYAASNKLALSGTDKWSHNDSDLQGQMDDGKEAVREKTGMHPNTLILPPKVMLRLKHHPAIKAHFTSSVAPNPMITTERLQEFFEIERIAVGKRTYSNQGNFQDIWHTHVVMAYVARSEGGFDNAQPSYGYTYQLRNQPVVEQTRWSDDHQSWLTPVEDTFQAQIVGAESGYLFQDVL